jgi:hypothetical protein
MIKVYCDTGGFRKELSQFESLKRIEILMFPYENTNRKIASTGVPSKATFADLNNFTWGNLPGTFGDYAPSELYSAIEKIVGKKNRVDVLHLDSAYKSGCSIFITSDKGDIANRKMELEQLLKIKIFHSTDDWENFVDFISGKY